MTSTLGDKIVVKSEFDLSLEAEGDPGYFENRDQNNLRIIEHYGYLVGSVYSESLRRDLSEKISREVRSYGTGVVKLNYDPSRLNIDSDENNVITRLFFG